MTPWRKLSESIRAVSFSIETPFGNIVLRVEGGHHRSYGLQCPQCPDIGDSHLVGRCFLTAGTILVEPDSPVRLSVEGYSTEGWRLGPDGGGQWFRCWSAWHASGLSGAYGMRDEDWFAECFGLEYFDVHQTGFSLRAPRRTWIPIEFAAALSAGTGGDDACWFAVNDLLIG